MGSRWRLNGGKSHNDYDSWWWLKFTQKKYIKKANFTMFHLSELVNNASRSYLLLEGWEIKEREPFTESVRNFI